MTDGRGILPQQPWRRISNPYPPIEVLAPEALERIHLASLDILERFGLEMLSGEALDILKRHGAAVDPSTRRVRLDRGLVLEQIAKAPRVFTLHARNPAHHVRVGADSVNFCMTAGPPNCADLDRGRRPGNLADTINLIKLAQSLNAVHCLSGMPVAPIDLPVPVRHLEGHYLHITLTDKVWAPSAIGAERVLDAIEIYRLSRGLDDEAVRREPGMASVINTNSPLKVDGPMLEGLMALVRMGQCAIVTPFTLAGAMSPVTIAGALAQQNAEALGVIAFAQMAAPGAPCIYGGFTSNVDMKSGAPAFGTPEYTKAAMAGGQLARRYGLPYRSSNCCAANAPDAQAGYESEMSIWGAVMGGANFVHHGVGWMEGGLVASYEKAVLDAEMLWDMANFLAPLPGAADWRTALAVPAEQPEAAVRRANRVWKRLLADYEPPPLDPAIDEAVRDFIHRRKREGGVKAA